MFHKTASRFTVTSLMAVTACLSLNAKAQAPSATVILFSMANHSTVSKSAMLSHNTGLAFIKAQVSDPNGLRSAALYGSNRSAGLFFPADTTSSSIGLYWNVAVEPVGTYTFTCSTFNTKKTRTYSTLTLTIVP